MIEVRKVANMPNINQIRMPILCHACGKPMAEDPEMKRLSFAESENASASFCLCSECTNHLKGILSIIG